ncbi:MAG: ABC transporter permease subunit [Chloroflexota bacterium]
MTVSTVGVPAPSELPAAGPASGGTGSSRFKRAGNYVALIPFHAYVGLFLLFPTLVVAIGAFTTSKGQLTLDNIGAVFATKAFIDSFVVSIQLALVTALLGAILGGLLSWAVVRGNPNGTLRQLVVAACGVLAQFGGVMLTFAFLAFVGYEGMVTLFIQNNIVHTKLDMSWVYSLTGLIMLYAYFQIPLMLIVFLPSLDGLRQEWYDASASLGGGAWSFWRNVGGPILAPSFLGALLLLFTNAFSAYATAQALISQGCGLVTQQIACQIQSEVMIGRENVGKALALGMIIIVATVMLLYAYIQRRASRWVK